MADDLDDLEARLRSAGYEIESDAPIYGMRRSHVSDPFGNRIEFLG